MLCKQCGAENTIENIKAIGMCVNCGTSITVETSEIKQGSYLDQSDKEHQDILDAASEADKKLERIPDPEQLTKSTSFGLFDKMRKVFGGGNDKTN